MNKEGFNQLVSDYSKADQKFQDLERLVGKYPYSQPIRLLTLKSSAKLSRPEYQKHLNLAALYSTDRNVLRTLVEKGQVPSDLPKAPPPTKKQASPAKKVSAEGLQKKPARKISDIERLRAEVMANLEKLQRNKALFLKLTSEGEMEVVTPTVKKTKKPAQTARKKVVAQQERVTTNEKSIKKSLKAKPKTSRSRSKKDEIIDKFIAEKPSISPNQKPNENQSDLSKPSSVLKEDLVSENLAVIFANQGKTTKAIEIYKKLIWKFPQKKASFAARIEELKKK